MRTTEAAFEVHPYDRRQPAVTFRARGAINLNSPAYNLLEKPDAVLLLFDAKNRRMAVKPSERGDSRAYPLNKHRKNNASIPASKFLEHYGIRPGKTIRYNAELEGGLLVVKL